MCEKKAHAAIRLFFLKKKYLFTTRKLFVTYLSVQPALTLILMFLKINRQLVSATNSTQTCSRFKIAILFSGRLKETQDKNTNKTIARHDKDTNTLPLKYVSGIFSVNSSEMLSSATFRRTV